MRGPVAIAILLVLTAGSTAGGEGTVSVGNALRYAISQENNEEILEDYFDADYTQGSFLARLRYEVFQPSEERRDREGQVFRAVGGQTSWGTLWIGHFYSLFGRGMAFHGYEDRDLRVDTSLDGLSVSVDHGPFSLQGLSGRTPGKSAVFHGVDGDVRPVPWLSFGGSYVSRRPTSTTGYTLPDLELGTGRVRLAAGPRGVAGLTLGPTDVFLEGGGRSRSGASERGEGWFLSVGTSVMGAAFGFEYKDYRSMSVVAEGKEYATPPPATVEHAWALLARHSHDLDANDERGVLGRLEWQPVEQVGVTASYARAQNHDGVALFEEATAELRWGEVSAIPVTAVVGRTEEYLGVAPTSEGTIDDRRTHLTAVADVTFPLGGPYGGRISAEHQHTDGEAVGEFDLEHVELEVSRSPGISVALVGEFTNASATQRTLPWLPAFEDATSWFYLQSVVDIARGHQLKVMVGSRPEGKVCAGGACRTVPAFKGIEASLSSMF